MRTYAALRIILISAWFHAVLAAQSSQVTTPITAANWGSVTSPVYGSFQSGAYAGVEPFAGPNQFGQYYAGVLPNGRKVNPNGLVNVQVGMNPIACVLTPDEQFLIVVNSSERQPSYTSYENPTNTGGYSLTVISINTLTVISELNTVGSLFTGILATGFGPYTVYVSGGADNNVKIFTLSTLGTLSPASPAAITIPPLLPANAGYVSNYSPAASAALFSANGYLPTGARMTFPAGMQFSPDGRYLYVACNADNSIAVIDVYQNMIVKQLPAGYFPYGIAVSFDGQRLYSTNWGVNQYQFANPAYDSNSGSLLSAKAVPGNMPAGYFVPNASTTGTNPSSSSVSLFNAPGGNGNNLAAAGAISSSPAPDDLYQVGGTHPNALVIVRNPATGVEILYYAKANSDSLGMVRLDQYAVLPDFDLSPVSLTLSDGHKVHGSYPTALAASPDAKTLYVAESGINSVAVIDISRPFAPMLLGRIPTGWYPTSLTLTFDGQFLFITNAKGVGEDINPLVQVGGGNQHPTGVASDSATDSNSVFGTVQVLQVGGVTFDNTTVLANNYSMNTPADTSVVPGGTNPVGPKGSSLIKHVFVIVHDNKTFDSILGGQAVRFGSFASQTFQNSSGRNYFNAQYATVTPNIQALAKSFATAVNFYSDAGESNAGAQFLGSGTSTDYTEKTVLVAGGRGLLANRNVEAEDYPEGGYIFNNAARNGVSFKDYGFLTTLSGSDNGTGQPSTLDDPMSGDLGYPQLQSDNATLTSPVSNAGDVTSPVRGLGQQYFSALPGLAVLGEKNPSGEPRLDVNYPGVNFNISDQRRALEFIQDFDRMVSAGTLPQLIYIYQPNDSTGSTQAPNFAGVITNTAPQQVADGDTALGMVVSHIMSSPVYYDPILNTGSAIFVTFASSQSTVDHIHPHRNLLVTISPFAKPNYLATRHYSTASVVKTAELLLGLPPNNLGDLFATDLRDMFQSAYNGISSGTIPFTKPAISRARTSTQGATIGR
jgi:YVTN family beta-propeller protein